MPHPNEAELLASLPPSAADPLRAALALERLWEPEPAKLMTQAMQALEWPSYRDGLPPASALTHDQRTVAEILAHRTGVYVPTCAIPMPAWLRRRWLGMEPETVMERGVDHDGATKPLWQWLRDSDGPAGASAVLSWLSPGDRLEAYCWLEIGAYPIKSMLVWIDWRPPELITAEHCRWAPAMAKLVLDIYDANVPTEGLTNGARSKSEWGVAIPISLKLPLFLALARCGEPIDPRFDSLLPTVLGTAQRPGPELVRECLAALPEPRRSAALMSALEHGLPSDQIYSILGILPAFPSAELTRAALARTRIPGGLPEKFVLGKLTEIDHPIVNEAVATYRANSAEGLGLKCVETLRPTISDLTPLMREQIVLTGKALDGESLAPEVRLDPGKEEPAFFDLRVLRIADKHGKLVYEAFLPDLDSGSVFAIGTTSSVAGVAQGGVECLDFDLREGLEEVLYDAKPKKKRAAKKQAPAAKKAPKKKAAPKKKKKKK